MKPNLSSLTLLAFGVSMLSLGPLIAEEFDVAGKYAQSCAVCHNSGVAGAPRKGDGKAWATRLSKGEEAVLANVKNGIGAMPAMGMCQDCSDDQLKALIDYMAK